MNFKSLVSGAAFVALAVAVAGPAGAVVIGNSTISVGVGPDGELYSDGVGIQRADGFDPLAYGAPDASARDSWGLSATRGGDVFDAVADYQSPATVGIDITTFEGATATTLTTFDFAVTQTFSFAADNILAITTSVTNFGADVDAAIFQRNIDWDIDPTPYNENVFGPSGSSYSLLDSSLYGFEDATASVPYGFSCASGCNQSGDLGAGIKIDLGAFGAGVTKYFTYYYGVNVVGQDVGALVAQGHGVGADYIIAGQSAENGDYPGLGQNSTFLGVSSVAVPEPSTWAMMLLGFFGLGAMVRRSKAALA